MRPWTFGRIDAGERLTVDVVAHDAAKRLGTTHAVGERGHGGQRTLGTKLRFLAVSLISYALNAFWVWLFYSHFDLGRAVPILPMLFVTPLVTFVLNRQWVFR